MLRRIASALRGTSGRKLVGTDAKGNQFFVEASVAAATREMGARSQGESEREKRVVVFADKFPDPTTVDPLWQAWLHHMRVDPPTAEEEQQRAMEAKRLAARVAEIEAADARDRLEEIAERTERGSMAEEAMRRMEQIPDATGGGDGGESTSTSPPPPPPPKKV